MATKGRGVAIDEKRRRDGDMFDWQWPKGQRMAKPKKGRRDNDMINSSVMATDNKWHDDQINYLA